MASDNFDAIDERLIGEWVAHLSSPREPYDTGTSGGSIPFLSGNAFSCSVVVQKHAYSTRMRTRHVQEKNVESIGIRESGWPIVSMTRHILIECRLFSMQGWFQRFDMMTRHRTAEALDVCIRTNLEPGHPMDDTKTSTASLCPREDSTTCEDPENEERQK